MTWFWLTIAAALVVAGLWPGISMWLVLRRPGRGRRSLAVLARARIGPVAPAGPQIMPVPRGE